MADDLKKTGGHGTTTNESMWNQYRELSYWAEKLGISRPATASRSGCRPDGEGRSAPPKPLKAKPGS
jgi:hypothetical protein